MRASWGAGHAGIIIRVSFRQGATIPHQDPYALNLMEAPLAPCVNGMALFGNPSAALMSLEYRPSKLRDDRRPATQPNETWAMDFVHDQLATGQKLRVLTNRRHVLGSFSLQYKATLNEISRMMGLPGKPHDIAGRDVEAYFLSGRIKEIADETDVVNTYRIWLRYELFRGRPTEDSFKASERSLIEFTRVAAIDPIQAIKEPGRIPPVSTTCGVAHKLQADDCQAAPGARPILPNLKNEIRSGQMMIDTGQYELKVGC